MWIPNEMVNPIRRKHNRSLLDFSVTATTAKSGLDVCVGEKDTVEMVGQDKIIA